MSTAQTPGRFDWAAHLRVGAFWVRFHMGRNLRRRSFVLWALGSIALSLGLRLFGWPTRLALSEAFLTQLAPILVLFFSAGVVREELEDRTLTYSHTRPVRRSWLYGARLIAALVPVALLCVPPLLAFADVLSGGQLLGFVMGLGAVVLCYGALFAYLGQLLRWPTWAGLAWLLFWELPIGQLPIGLERLTVLGYVRVLAQLPAKTRFELPWLPNQPASWPTALLVLTALTALGFYLGGRRVSRRELDASKSDG